MHRGDGKSTVVRGARVADGAQPLHVLVAAAMARDEQAYRQLDGRLRGPVRAQLSKRLGADAASLDELTQQAVSEALQALVSGRFQPGRASFITFAYAVTHRVRLRYLQNRRREKARSPANMLDADLAELLSGFLSDDRDLVPLEQIEAMRDCLRVEGVPHALSAEERYAVIGRAHDKTFEMLARELGRGLDTVFRRCKRGIDKLRACMRAKGYMEG